MMQMWLVACGLPLNSSGSTLVSNHHSSLPSSLARSFSGTQSRNHGQPKKQTTKILPQSSATPTRRHVRLGQRQRQGSLSPTKAQVCVGKLIWASVHAGCQAERRDHAWRKGRVEGDGLSRFFGRREAGLWVWCCSCSKPVGYAQSPLSVTVRAVVTAELLDREFC